MFCLLLIFRMGGREGGREMSAGVVYDVVVVYWVWRDCLCWFLHALLSSMILVGREMVREVVCVPGI